MSKKSLKKFIAISLAASMAIGNSMAVFAEDVAGVSEGTGSYEGGEMKYPTLSVTLPTIPAGTYDYIADPNGLIAATQSAKYANSTFTGTTGVFFLTSTADNGDKTYTEKSASQKVINENAQDIDVTVKLEQKTAGDAIVKYADNANFDSSDTENKLYLAITDGAASNPNVAALTANGAAIVKTTIDGVTANYTPGYNNGKYEYVKKDEADLTDWNECSFILTGAINTNATWGDNVTFPEIKVTWSYKEHVDSPTVTETSISGTNNVIHFAAPSDVALKKVELVKSTGATTLSSASHYTINETAGTITMVANVLSNNVGNKIKVYFDNEPETVVELTIVQ